ncbi:unnamed protein product [Ectocarpus sp. 12 AP-2014]
MPTSSYLENFALECTIHERYVSFRLPMFLRWCALHAHRGTARASPVTCYGDVFADISEIDVQLLDEFRRRCLSEAPLVFYGKPQLLTTATLSSTRHSCTETK